MKPLRPRGRGRRRGRLPRLVLLPVAALAIGAVAAAIVLRGRPTSAPANSSGLPDSIAALEPWPSYRRALALGESGRFAESLPYYRRALEVPPQAWEPHCAYATSLFQATHETRPHLGSTQPVTRSSWERVAMLREAAHQIDAAERYARTARDQAFVISARAQQLAVWGLSWNAISEYARAARGAPGESLRIVAISSRMRDPLRRDGE